MSLAVIKHAIAVKAHRVNYNEIKEHLPPKTEFVLTLPLTPLQRKLYDKVIDVLENQKDALKYSFFGPIALLTLLCNHPKIFMDKLTAPRPPIPKESNCDKSGSAELDDELDNNCDEEENDGEDTLDVKNTRGLGFSDAVVQEFRAMVPDDLESPVHSHRAQHVKRLVQLADTNDDSILLFSRSLPTLDYFENLLKGCGYTVGRVDGTTPDAVRYPTLYKFDDRRIRVLLLSTGACSLGLNLQVANRVIVLDFGFNPTNEIQAIRRSHRMGQQKPVFAYRLITGGTFEQQFCTILLGRKLRCP